MPVHSAFRLKSTPQGTHREKFSWRIQAIYETECPVSKITERSMDLIQIVNGLMGVQAATGSALPVESMPGYLFDAIRIIRHESQSIEAAMDEELYRS
jgi:hypothetical protein